MKKREDSGVFILKAGSTFPELARENGDFDSWIRSRLGARDADIHLLMPGCGQTCPETDRVGGVVISGSHSMLTDKPTWVPEAVKWIRALVEREIPVLGICFGHQLLAQAFGGKVGFLQGGPEYGMTRIRCLGESRGDPLLQGLGSEFAAYVAHSQTVRQLPSDAVLLASSERDSHQVFRLGSAWGVQFHPEFNAEIMRFYVARLRSEVSQASCLPVDAKADEASRVLWNFGRILERRRTSQAV